jgi:hypothetical protein
MARILAQQGNLVVVDFGRTEEPLLSKKQLAAHPSVRRSSRWIEQRVAEGMPSSLDERGRRQFRLEEVRAWLESRKKTA